MVDSRHRRAAAGGHRRPASGRRLLAGRAGGAIVSQGVTALASLVLQVIAARTLGAGGYGAYAVCLAILVTVAALYTGWVGDSLTVMDRFDPDVRGAVVVSVLGGCLIGAVVSGVLLLVFTSGTLVSAVVFAGLIVCWLLEETGRRVLMARLEFGRLVLNDCCYFLVAVAAVVVGRWVGFAWSLTLLFGAMLVGAVAAILLVVFQVPSREFGALRPSVGGFGRIFAFAGWRSSQATLRPLSLLVARVLVAQVSSLATVGAFEAARLLLAPVQTVINGAGSFLLSAFAANRRDGSGGTRRLAAGATWLLVAMVLVGGGIVTLLVEPFGGLLTDGGFPISQVAVFGWAVYLATWAATLPAVADAVARKLSRQVFLARLTDSLVGISAAAVALALGASYELVPWLLSTGSVVALIWLYRLLSKDRRAEVASGTTGR